MGLVLALVVFVFGLLPQGRGRLTYREFLRRTGALPLTTFNVASLLFNGMVLLGTGHQVPPVGTAQGHGWAVTLASIVALVSTGTIVVVLARALRAINPETEADVQREYQRVAVALASRDELLELESLQVMAAGTGPYTFSPAYPGPGLTISLAGPGQRVVRDVLVWRLHLLKQGASWRSRNPPVVRAWPGKPVTAGAPLMTVDPSSGWLERWWAQHCVRVRPARSDLLGNALTALHGETLEHVRAGRQAEAVGGMRALGSLQVLLWQAYAAHGRAYGPDAGRPLALRQGVGERIDVLLDDLLRAAAVSGDDAVRREATELPRVIARDALSRGVPGTVRQIMRQLEGVYIAVVGELSEGGLRELPLTGLARSRLDAPFRSLLSFVNYYLAQAIDQAAAGGTTGWDGRPLPSAEFLLAQLRASDEAMLHLLRRAVQFRDSATVRRVLNAWKMPDLPLARNAIQQAAGGGTAPVGGTGAAASVQGLAQSLRDTEADLDAMILRLLVTALDADRTAQREASPPGAQPSGEARTSHDDMPVDPDLAVNAILARLPDGRLWDILDRAIQIADGDWAWQFPDDEILPAGVVKTLPVDTISPLMEAFALAAIARPGLVARTHPSHWLALDRGSALITAVHQALADQMPWLLRYGCTRDTADREAADLRARLEQAEQDARREQEEEIRKSPVRAAVKEELRQAARSSFRESDIAGALFAWAGRLVPETGLQPAEVTLIAPRRGFTAIENGDGAMASHGRQIGRRLAAQALGQMMITVSRAGEKRDVHRADLAAAVRDAIAEVSGIPPTETGRHHLSTVRVAVFIPDSPYDLRNDLEITGAAQRGGLEAARGRVISELCIKEEGLASQVAGTVDGVPVITVGALEGQVLVIDLARFGELRRGTSGGAYSSEPELTLLQPDDPLRPPDGTAAAPARESQTDLLKVQVTLSLPADIAISDPSAARVLRIR